MDWIEQLFGIEPDMGSGSLETLIVGAVVVVVVALLLGRRARERADEKTH